MWFANQADGTETLYCLTSLALEDMILDISNDLMSSDNKLLPQPMLTKTANAMWRNWLQWVNDLKYHATDTDHIASKRRWSI